MQHEVVETVSGMINCSPETAATYCEEDWLERGRGRVSKQQNDLFMACFAC